MDLDAKFEPGLLNTAIYLLGLSQQVSTFAINFQVCARQISLNPLSSFLFRVDLSARAFGKIPPSGGVSWVRVPSRSLVQSISYQR